MTTSAQIVSLIKQIRGTASTLQRVKLVALAWRTLRGLAREEQLAVAKEIGLEGAEKLVDKLANRGGISPADLLRAIREAEFQGIETASKVDELLAEIIPDEQSAAASRTAVTTQAAVAGEQTEEPAVITAQQPPRSAVLGQHKPFPEPEPPAFAGPPPFPDTPAPASTPAPVVNPSQPPASVGKAPGTRQAESRDRGVVKAPAPQRDHWQPREHKEPWGSGAALPEAVAGEHEAGLLADLAAAASLLQRLRMLGTRIDEAEGFDLDRLQRLLELYPAGWSRRRAFEELVRTGIPARIDDTLELVERTLESTSERFWALTTLQQERALGPGSQEKLLAAAEGAMVRRRLQLRLGRQEEP